MPALAQAAEHRYLGWNMTATGDPHVKERLAFTAALVVVVAGIALIALTQPSLEQPIFFVCSAVALGLLLRLAAFPLHDGLLVRSRNAVSFACATVIAIALTLWCPWEPIHASRGILTLGALLLQSLAPLAFRAWRPTIVERDHADS